LSRWFTAILAQFSLEMFAAAKSGKKFILTP